MRLKATDFNVTNWEETRLLYLFAVVSAAVHLLLFTVDLSGLMRSPPPLPENWEIEADLALDLDVSSAAQSALPKSVPADKPDVPDNILPQLTKRFSVKDQAGPMEEAETVVEDKEKGKDGDSKIKLNVKTDDEANQLKAEDALKRLALEKLRRQLDDQKSKTVKAPKKSELAQLKEDLAKREMIHASLKSGTGGKTAEYIDILKRAIRRNWSLPEAYNLKNANIFAVIHLVLNENGGLVKAEWAQKSGDRAFDDLAFKAVRDSVPLPRPPRDLVGTPIPVQFSPKSI